ncbi:DUF397 domain-containing protein [Actinokineospora inagensis]|uniref:DUF397 domain-containing protein n=1 Tax=Actinokineospora inagensis TaxID=103730 RepID=UPI0003F97C3C|nr:DUF397 domain-containing protein [Actinokineospora inagensis]
MTDTNWRRSSFSGGGGQGGGNCVELAHLSPTTAAVRDSKAPHRPALLLPTTALTTWLTTVR